MVKQKIVQFQRNEKFNKEVLKTISVLAKDIYWVKPGKEILFEGKLFDVKSFKIQENRIFLTGFFDHKENTLVQQTVKLAKQNQQSGNPLNNTLIKLIFFPTYILDAQLSPEVCWNLISLPQYHLFDENIPGLPSSKLLHPPRL